MGKISDYANVLKSKLTDLFVVYQRNEGELETKNATLEQLGDAICGEQVHATLETDDQTIIGGINENKDKVDDLSTPETITPTFNSQQSDYSIPYNNTSVVKVGKVVMCMINPRCLNSVGSYPGTLVYSGFPKPIDGLNHYFTIANWQRTGNLPIRFMLTANGEIYLRNGTVDSEYDGSFMYFSE